MYIYIFIQEIYICTPIYIQIELCLNFSAEKKYCVLISFLTYKKLIKLFPAKPTNYNMFLRYKKQ